MKSISFQPLARWFRSDGRHFQIVSQVTFLCYGILLLQWNADIWKYTAAIGGCVFAQLLAILFANAPRESLKSALITGLGLSLLLKAGSPWLFLFAAFFAIGQKFLLRINGKHLWNPANFGIIILILLNSEAWVSPGQWGSSATLIFIIGTAGLAVLSRVQRLDTGIAYLLTFLVLEYSRTILYLGWDYEVLFHRLSNGTLWLFAFFMITDPMTTPNNRTVRIIWAIVVASASFIGINFFFKSTSPQWVLFLATPLTPLIDYAFKGQSFHWVSFPKTPKLSFMKPLSLLLALLLFVQNTSYAFCGFYVAKADATLFNNKSEVILVRDGLHTVITMSNDFKGDVEDFAMVVPVPVVLKESQIKVVDRSLFDVLDSYSSPRLAEYYDNHPCYQFEMEVTKMVSIAEVASSKKLDVNEDSAIEYGVTIEASYSIGEYDILLLSATQSTGLKTWLIENGYRIPPTAEEVLQPYIKSNMKFFVVKVNLENMQSTGYDQLRPIQISFDHEKFMLPIRLGMANSTGVQDMIVYAFTRQGRVECTNYRTVEVPSNKNIPLFVRNDFGQFYLDVFDRTYRNAGRNAVMLEYAWDVTPNWGGMKCDPCVGPPPLTNDLAKAGITWLNQDRVFFTRMHVRYTRDRFPADLTFQVTPNTQQFQARYVLHNPAQGPFDCEEAENYLQDLRNRRKLELDELYALTGKSDRRFDTYLNEYNRYMKNKPEDQSPSKPIELQNEEQPKKKEDAPISWTPPSDASDDDATPPSNGNGWIALTLLGMVMAITLFASRKEKNKPSLSSTSHPSA
ncbi:MAG: DUF2330 domain-containing protein [Flavobacteriales bacterium]